MACLKWKINLFGKMFYTRFLNEIIDIRLIPF